MSETHTGLAKQLRATAQIVASQQVQELLFTAAGVITRLSAAPGDDDEARAGTRLAAGAEAEARYAALSLAAAPLLDVFRAGLRWRAAVERLDGVVEAKIALVRAIARAEAAGVLPREDMP